MPLILSLPLIPGILRHCLLDHLLRLALHSCQSVSPSVVSDFCNPMDYSPPGSSVPGILQVRILEWVAISYSRRSYWPRNQTRVSCIWGRFFTIWATGEVLIPVRLLSMPSAQVPASLERVPSFSLPYLNLNFSLKIIQPLFNFPQVLYFSKMCLHIHPYLQMKYHSGVLRSTAFTQLTGCSFLCLHWDFNSLQHTTFNKMYPNSGTFSIVQNIAFKPVQSSNATFNTTHTNYATLVRLTIQYSICYATSVESSVKQYIRVVDLSSSSKNWKHLENRNCVF